MQDETRLCRCPEPGTDYHLIGCQPRVPSPGRSTAHWLFGTIDVASGQGLYQIFEHAPTAEFLRHLDDLLQLFPDDHLLLVTAQASWHSSDAVRAFQAHVDDRLEFIPLPSQSPHLNASERLWGYVRDHVTRNTFWGTLAGECQAVIAFLDALDFLPFQTLMSTSPCLC